MHYYSAYNLRIQSEIELRELPSAPPGSDLTITVERPQDLNEIRSIEFDDGGIAHLVAKIPDQVSGGKGTTAKIAPLEAMKSMQM